MSDRQGFRYYKVTSFCLAAGLMFALSEPGEAAYPNPLDGFNPQVIGSTLMSVAVQPDGKILVGGSFSNLAGQARSNIGRLNADGSLDNTFSNAVSGTVNAIAVQNDGKILVGGSFSTVAGQLRGNLGRLNADGSLDVTFTNSAGGTVFEIVVQPDGKALVGGSFTNFGGQLRRNLVRLNEDGSIDSSFYITNDVGAVVNALAVQPDGKILVGGSFATMAGQARSRIGRLHANGTLDATFIPTNGTDSTVYALALQPDGKILVGGMFSNLVSHACNRVGRLNPDGSWDPSFKGTNGANNTVNCITVQPDGKILVGGNFTYLEGQVSQCMGRLYPDGSLDNALTNGANATVQAFAVQPDGKVLVVGGFGVIMGQSRTRIGRLHGEGLLDGTLTNGANGEVHALATQPDGKILAGGYFTTMGGKPRSSLGRLHGDGSVDNSLSNGVNGVVHALAVLGDGKILVGGNFTNLAGQTCGALGRLAANGTRDQFFTTSLDFSGWVNSMVEQPDGKILIGGMFSSLGGQARSNLGRLNADGSLDEAFTGGADGEVFSIALQEDQKILIGGAFGTLGGQPHICFGRLNADGSADNAFSCDSYGVVKALAVQPDGRILVGGSYTNLAGQTRRGLGRINADGSLDNTFTNGVSYSIGTLALQCDGKIIVGGSFSSLGGQFRSNLGRLNADGSLDSTFTNGPNNEVYALVTQPDGKVLLGGVFSNLGGVVRTNMARITMPEMASQSLEVAPSGSSVNWVRGGSSPEVWRTTLEFSGDGYNWESNRVAGSRMAGGWQFTGLAIPGNTTGWVRARGYISSGQYNGSQSIIESVRMFYTSPYGNTNDVLFTVDASDITSNSATVNGAIYTEAPSAVSIGWGTSPGGAAINSWQHSTFVGILSNGNFSSSLSPLFPDTTYYCRCYATNQFGCLWSTATVSFATAPDQGSGGSLVLPFTPSSQNTVIQTGAGIHHLEGGCQLAAAYDSKLYFALRDDGSGMPAKVMCYDPRSGVTNVIVQSSAAGDAFVAIRAMQGVLYISHVNGMVWKYDGMSLSEITGAGLSPTNWVTAMAEFNGKLYFGTSSGRIYESSDGVTLAHKATITAGKPIKTLEAWQGFLYGANHEDYSYSSKIFRSGDGSVWSNIVSLNVYEFEGLVATPTHLYLSSIEDASGPSFAIRATTNGTDWTRIYHTTSLGKSHDGSPVYFSQTGKAYFLTHWNNANYLLPVAGGAVGSEISVQCGFNSLVEVNSQLYGVGAYSLDCASSPYVISCLGFYGPPQIDNAGGVSNVTSDSAVLNGNLSFTGSSLTWVGIFWGDTDWGTNAAAWAHCVDMGVLGIGAFATPITGLVDGVTYYYRCLGSNSYRTAWSPVATGFTTLGPVTLTIESAHGAATPPPGVYTNLPGTVLTNWVSSPVTQGTTQYVCTGWTGTGSVPASGTNASVVVTLTTNSTLTWLWTTNYWLGVASSGSGTVNMASGWLPLGATNMLTATAAPGWRFVRWTGDTNGCVIDGNQIFMGMTQSRVIEAVFESSVLPKRVVVINPDGCRILKMGVLNGEVASTNDYRSLASATVADANWTIETNWSGVGVHGDFIAAILSNSGYQVDTYEAGTMPVLTSTTCHAVIVLDPLRDNLRTFSKENEICLPDLLESVTNQQFIARLQEYWQSGGAVILVGDAVRLMENGSGRLGLGKVVNDYSVANIQSQPHPNVPARWLFLRGNPFCGVDRSGSATYDVESSQILPSGLRFMNLALFDGNDIPFALTWSDTIYYPSDGVSLLDIHVVGSADYVLDGSTCTPPVYQDSIDDIVQHYMGYTVSGGRRIYYIGSDSFFDYTFRGNMGAWHAGQYLQMQAGFTAAAKEALASLVEHAIAESGSYKALTNGLVAWHAFDGNLNDGSGNANDGAANGAIPASDRFGGLTNAYAFSGNGEHVVVADSPSLRITGSNITLAAWVWPTNFWPGKSIVLRKMDHPSRAGGYLLGITDEGRVQFGGRFDTGEWQNSATNGVVVTGRWSHVAASYNGAVVAYYINGRYVDSVPFTGCLQADDQPLAIGRITPSFAGEYFYGKMDDVRVYNRTLSSSEVNLLYKEGDVDGDGDGIPDWWTLQYFGHATGQGGDASRAEDDPDGDQYANLEEYRNGTVPTEFTPGGASAVTFAVTSACDFVTPPPGVYTNLPGTVLTNWVSSPVTQGPTQYVCTGWTGTGSVPSGGSSTAVVFTITADSTLVWNWSTQVVATLPVVFNRDEWTTNITATSAIMNGYLASTGNVGTTFMFFQGPADCGTNEGAWNRRIFIGQRGVGNWSAMVSNLLGSTTYYYRCMASNAVGVAWASNTVSFTTLTGNPDADGDGIPDRWELDHFGTTNGTPALDSDSDGASNLDEYLAGTDPTNTMSVFAISSTMVATGYPQIVWSSVTGRTYAVLVSSNGVSGFVPVGTNLQATAPLNTYRDVVAPGGSRYYRIALEGVGTNEVFGVGDAVFHTLATSVSGSGTVSVADSWWVHGSTGVVTATAATNSYFVKWTGTTNGCAIAGDQLTCLMDQSRTLTANFAVSIVPPVVQTAGATNITASSAVLNGYLSSTGGSPTVVAIYWGMTDGGGNGAAWSNCCLLGVRPNGFLATNVTGLANSTLYYYRCWASNAAGAVWASLTTNFMTLAPPVRTLAVVSAHGAATPPPGIYTNALGSTLTNWVSTPDTQGTTQYVCTGWTGTGSVPATGSNTSMVITLATNSTLTWRWATNYWLAVTNVGSGTVSGGNNWIRRGSNAVVVATPSAGYQFVNWTGDIAASTNPVVLPMTRAYTLMAHFQLSSNTITATAGPNGSVNPSGAVSVPYAGSQTFTNLPDAHYHVQNVVIDGVTNGPTASYTFNAVTNPHNYGVNFALDRYQLNASTPHGTCTPQGLSTNDWNTMIQASVSGSPVELGLTQYVIRGWTGTGSVASGLGTNTSFTITNNSTLSWKWTTNFWLTVTNLGGGTVSATNGWYSLGSNVVITATPAFGYIFGGWTGETAGCTISSNIITARMVQARTIRANFGLRPYAVWATAGAGGSITPSGSVIVPHGYSTNFLVEAAAGFHIARVLVDSRPVGEFGPGSNLFACAVANVTSNRSIEARFNSAPAIGVSVDPVQGVAPLRVKFDFTPSVDAQNNIVRSEIDRNGDGLADWASSGESVIIGEYACPGVYTNTLKVTDGFGLSDTTSVVVTVWGQKPTASLEAHPVSNPAPLTVTFTGTNSAAALNHRIVVHEWDFDGDGTYDQISQTGVVTHVYREPGDYAATLRVTDDQGLQDKASVTITVAPPEFVPPTVTLQAAPDSGTIPLAVNFTAEVSNQQAIVEYRWDFDGDGVVDLRTSTGTTSRTYSEVGTYAASVTVVDEVGLSGKAMVPVTARQASSLRAWVVQPKAGETVSGSAVSVNVNAVPANEVALVQAQYRQTNGDWFDIGGPMVPPASDFRTTWCVTNLADGTVCELRALSVDSAGAVVTSAVVWVTVDASAGNTEGDKDGKHAKQQTFSTNETARLEVYDGTAVTVPLGTVDSNVTVEVVLTGTNTNPDAGSAYGQANIQMNRTVTLEGHPDLKKPITITIPYPDENNDGLVDGTSIPENTLTAYWYDTSDGQWKKPLSCEVNTSANFVRITTYHLTEFGVYGSLNLLNPASGGILKSCSFAGTNATAAINLADGNTASYWMSPTNSGAQEFVYTFTNYQGAICSRAVLYNYGQTESGLTNYSRDFEILVSMDVNGAAETFHSVTSGVLPMVAGPVTIDMGSVTCRVVKLVVASGYAAQFDLAEFELQGALTSDPNGNGMTDAWEMQYFGNVERTGTEDYDTDALSDLNEFIHAANPRTNDTDGDGMTDGWEVQYGLLVSTNDAATDTDQDGASNVQEYIAGTNPTNGESRLQISQPAFDGSWFTNVFWHNGEWVSWDTNIYWFEDQWLTGTWMNVERYIINWETVSGRTYRLYSTTNLSGTWQTNSSGIPGTGGRVIVTNEMLPEPCRFFKLDVEFIP